MDDITAVIEPTLISPPPVDVKGWTTEREDLLKSLWGQGYSASTIANRLACSLTRNAVIGKAHRMGLAGRKGEAAPIQPKKKNITPAQKAAQKLNSTARALGLPPKEIMEAAEEIVENIPEVRTDSACDIFNISIQTCKYGVGDPREDNFYFCGKPPFRTGSVYCLRHHMIVYLPPKPRRAPQGKSQSI